MTRNSGYGAGEPAEAEGLTAGGVVDEDPAGPDGVLVGVGDGRGERDGVGGGVGLRDVYVGVGDAEELTDGMAVPGGAVTGRTTK